jgi:U3 small nucleolar RNA-associated protein 21
LLQWENLLHLDTIKARSKPLQPPKKPEAAPFFLPTVPTLAGQPTFDTDPSAAAAAADGDAHDFDDSDDDGGNAGSRVLRSRVLRSSRGAASAAAAPSAFVALLRSSAAAGDYAGFMGHVRSLSPAGLDRELRSMMILGPPLLPDAAAAGGGLGEDAAEQQQEVGDVAALLEALLAELDAGRNFEMVQALTARVLAVSLQEC